LWATLIWGATGIGALFTYMLTEQGLQAVWGPGVQPPWLFGFLPVGHMVAVAVVAAAVWMTGRSFCGYLALPALRWGDIGRGIGYGLLCYVVLIITSALYPLMFGAGSAPNIVQGLTSDGTALALLTLWMAMVIAAPIAEELLYRGLLYRGLESRLGAAGAVVLTAVAFGLVHYPGFGWVRVVATGCVGLLLGWVRWRTGNTGVAIVAHATMNIVGAALLTMIVLLS
jgi:membrane protease YdiL (CAAX protease family)